MNKPQEEETRLLTLPGSSIHSCVVSLDGRRIVARSDRSAFKVWECTRSLYGRYKSAGVKHQYGYPYNPSDGRENLEARDDALRVQRGGAFHEPVNLSCTARGCYFPRGREVFFGFRVCVAPGLAARR